MAVECPAPGCEFEGLLDSVSGHIGGKTDDLHAGVVPDRIGDDLELEDSIGLSGTQVVLIVAGLGLLLMLLSKQPTPEPQQNEQDGLDGIQEAIDGA